MTEAEFRKLFRLSVGITEVELLAERTRAASEYVSDLDFLNLLLEGLPLSKKEKRRFRTEAQIPPTRSGEFAWGGTDIPSKNIFRLMRLIKGEGIERESNKLNAVSSPPRDSSGPSGKGDSEGPKM